MFVEGKALSPFWPPNAKPTTCSLTPLMSQSTAPQVADVDYLFIQCPIEGEKLDFTGNCGNMLSGVGPFAFEEGLIPPSVLISPTNVMHAPVPLEILRE